MVTEAARRPIETAPVRSGVFVRVTAVIVAIACSGFASVNVFFEATGFIRDGADAAYASGFTVLNWFVVGLKLVGAATALWSAFAAPRGTLRQLLGLALWGACAMLGFYTLGNLCQSAGMLLGHFGGAGQLNAKSIAYVAFFTLLAAGFAVLAASFHRRGGLRAWVPVVGAVSGPLMIGIVLMVIPAVLVALGIMPPV